jgi:hypothetical protein
MGNNVYEKNLIALKKYHPEVLGKIIRTPRANPGEYEIIRTKSSYPTLRINDKGKQYYLHSKYDPIKEAEKFAEEKYEKGIHNYIVYGFGLSYHLQKLLEKDREIKLYVYEANKHIFKAAFENVDLQEILGNPKVKIVLEDERDKFARQLKEALEIDNKKLVIHLPSLQAMPEGFLEIRYLLENYRLQENTVTRHISSLEDNFKNNIQKYGKNVDVLFGQFKGIPIAIVSAGPSLDKNKSLLKEVKNKAVVMSVGTAAKPLLSAGVYPDIIIITDPQEIVYNQLEGLDIDIPIIVLSTCNKKVLENYRGFSFLALQEGYEPAEQYARKNGNRLVRTGGSVATTALDVGIRFGCNPVIFVGQDLAYTNNKTHAEGTYFYQRVEDNKTLRPVEGISGDVVYTSKNLHTYLRWIENRIKEEGDVAFINATEGGAKIEGTATMSLREVIDNVLIDKSYPIFKIIEEAKKRAE